MHFRNIHKLLLAVGIAASTVTVAESVTAEVAAAEATPAKKTTAKKTTAKATGKTAGKTAGKKTTAAKKKTTAAKKKTTTKAKTTTAAKNSSTATRKKKTTPKKTTVKKTSKKTTAKPAQPVEQPSNDPLTLRVNNAVLAWIPEAMDPGGLRVNSVKPDATKRMAAVSLNENFTYLPVTRKLIDDLSKCVSKSLPDSLRNYTVSLSVKSKPLAYYITTIDKLPERYRKNVPFVVEVNPEVKAPKGMEGDIVALWHSHGRYYKPADGTWLWQRPLLFETVEDTYTMGYILPYVVPMLENAGAYVMLPRERDTNVNEVIVDNDTNEDGMLFSQTTYQEHSGKHKWSTGELEGFIYDLPDFRDTENPFENGTYRQVETTHSGNDVSLAAWCADIPEDGEYAVYVSYKSLPESTQDALYTINYSGGSRSFKVNQTMGGGTWIYLGTFPLEAGFSDTEPVVVLSNLTEGKSGTIVTADAVKIGGGMGNIARSPRRADIYYDPSVPPASAASDSDGSDEETDEGISPDDIIGDTAGPENSTNEASRPKGPAPKFVTSGMPRFVEGARYWLHWAGFPESVYSPYHGSDDYKDDYTSRGHWVNYLAGGSRVLPNAEGLGIPVDVAFALHSDAGKRADDTFVGTLGIYFTNNGDTYTDGTPRSNSRTLTDMLMRQITGDIRKTFEPTWTRRSMWDKSYVEARVPEVPTTLIELMSHQNFADMRYGLDPSFRFTVGRAIYKALARFVSERKNREVVIQPMPVEDFAIIRESPRHYRLSWAPQADPLEPTAMPTRYLIMERTDDELGWHFLATTHETHFKLEVEDHDLHSYRIIAANEGGRAFPSEVLALREAPDGSDPILVVNGFTRVAGPGEINSDGNAGFSSMFDFGVPYIKDISFTGHQTEMRRAAGESHGRSESNYATQVIAGNTFDYPYLHGRSIAAAGMGFVSASASAVEKGNVHLDKYPVVDLILGKQRATVTGNGMSGVRFTAFPEALRKALTSYTSKGGDLLVSGQYVADELFGMRSSSADRSFGQEVLGIVPSSDPVVPSGYAHVTAGAMGSNLAKGSLAYSSTLNSDCYVVEMPDGISPATPGTAAVAMTAGATDTPVGVLHTRGKSNTATLTIPFESITDPDTRNSLMRQLLDFLKR